MFVNFLMEVPHFSSGVQRLVYGAICHCTLFILSIVFTRFASHHGLVLGQQTE